MFKTTLTLSLSLIVMGTLQAGVARASNLAPLVGSYVGDSVYEGVYDKNNAKCNVELTLNEMGKVLTLKYHHPSMKDDRWTPGAMRVFNVAYGELVRDKYFCRDVVDCIVFPTPGAVTFHARLLTDQTRTNLTSFETFDTKGRTGIVEAFTRATSVECVNLTRQIK